jgi:GNAT superfamily N-acetyltransferase
VSGAVVITHEYRNETVYEGLRKCVISIQDYERSIEPRVPRGQDIVDEYVPVLFRRCKKYKGKILVADVERTIAGYVLILCKMVSEDIVDGDMEFGLVGDLVVLEEFRNKGYGTKLLAAAEHEAKANNVKWLRIGVLSANHTASKLYLSKGFNPLSAELEKELS